MYKSLLFLLIIIPALAQAFSGPPEKPPVPSFSISGPYTGDVQFSPNYDGSRDTLQFVLGYPTNFTPWRWEIMILDKNGRSVRTIRGLISKDSPQDFFAFLDSLSRPPDPPAVPRTVEWDGSGDRGGILPEGQYYACFRIMDKSGQWGTSRTNTVTIDLTPPYGHFGLDDDLFSPNGDNIRDTITFFQELSAGDSWRGEIRNSSGEAVRTWTFGKNAPEELTWDGRSDSGTPAPTGIYDYIAVGMDDAGNMHVMRLPNLRLTTRRYSAFLSASERALSPNGDGVYDTLELYPTFSDTNGLTACTLVIQSSNGATLRRWDFQSAPPRRISWDGRDEKGTAVPDGLVYIRTAGLYIQGDKPVSEPLAVRIDTTPPRVYFETAPRPFSPDGDQEGDILMVQMKLSDPSPIKAWSIQVLDPDRKVFKTFEGRNSPPAVIRWDGRSDRQEPVESARDYSVVLSAEDELGNRAIITNVPRISVDVLVERTERGYKIRINAIEFSYNQSDLLPAAYPILDRVLQILSRYKDYRVEIQGHTDNVGDREYNLGLSLARSRSVYDYLVLKGIDPARLKTSGYGFDYPVADNLTEEGRRKNRRVEFLLIKTTK